MDSRRQLAIVGALMVLACLVQAWTIVRAVVPAQDSVRYLAVAQAIGRDGLLATLRNQPEQPLFPAFAYVTHETLTRTGLIAGRDWATSLQVAAAIPLVISVAPVYLLFRRWHGHWPAALSTALYCLLGATARLGADGLSDSTHLLLFWCAVAAAAAAFERATRARARSDEHGSFILHPSSFILFFFVSGLLTGLALLTRAEAVVLPVAVLGGLLLSQVGRVTRQARSAAWQPEASVGERRANPPLPSAVVLSAAMLMLGLALPLVPYLIACRADGAALADAIAPAADRLLGRLGAGDALPLNESVPGSAVAVGEPRWSLPGIGRLVFGKKDTSSSSRFRGWRAAAVEAICELAQTLHYWLGLLALIGLWSARGRLSSPVDRLMQLLCAALVAATLYVGATAGYLSTRHLLLLVVLALGWAGVGTLVCGEWLAARFFDSEKLSGACCRIMRWLGQSLAHKIADMQTRVTGKRCPGGGIIPTRRTGASLAGNRFSLMLSRVRPALPQPPTNGRLLARSPRFLSTARAKYCLAVMAVITCLPDLARPLHASRAGHREAAEWLLAHAAPGDRVLDSRGWTALYTGQKTYRYEAAQTAFLDAGLAYVVVEQAELDAPSRRAGTLRLLMDEAAEPVARFGPPLRHEVVVHRWRPERFALGALLLKGIGSSRRLKTTRYFHDPKLPTPF